MLRRPLLLSVFLATAVAVPALAQTSGGQLQYNPTCTTASARQEDKDSAAKLFEVAKKSLNESDFDRAISLFKQSYDFYCAPEILLWLADAFERKGDRPEAVRALLEYERRSPDLPQDKKDQIDRRIRNLGGIPSGTGSATAPATTTSSTATTPTTSTATSTATATAPTATSTGTTAPTATATPGGGGHSVAPWILVGVGGAAIITGAVLLPVGAGKVSDAQNQCPSRKNCTASVTDEGNSGRSLETVGVIVGAIGLAAVAGGLVWHFVEPTGPSAQPTTGMRVTPVVAPGYAGFAAGGAF